MKCTHVHVYVYPFFLWYLVVLGSDENVFVLSLCSEQPYFRAFRDSTKKTQVYFVGPARFRGSWLLSFVTV